MWDTKIDFEELKKVKGAIEKYKKEHKEKY